MTPLPSRHYIGVRRGEENDVDFPRWYVEDEPAGEMLGTRPRVDCRVAAPDYAGGDDRGFARMVTHSRGAVSAGDRVAAPEYAAEGDRSVAGTATRGRGAESAGYWVAAPEYAAESVHGFARTGTRGRGVESEKRRVAAPGYAVEEEEDSGVETMLRTPAFYSRGRRPGLAGEGALREDFQYSPQRVVSDRAAAAPHYLTDVNTPPRGTVAGRDNSTARASPSPKGHVKLPQYSGEEPIESYRIQVELAAQLNGWSDAETAMGLAVALKGRAAQVLTSLRREERLDYCVLMGAPGRFGAHRLCARAPPLSSERAHWRVWPEDIPGGATRGREGGVNAVGPQSSPSCTSLYVRQAGWVEDQCDEEEAVQSAASAPPRQEKKMDIRRQPGGRSQAACYRCGEPGHIARNCPAPAPLNPPPAPALNERRAT